MNNEQTEMLRMADDIEAMTNPDARDKANILYGMVRASQLVGGWSEELESRWRVMQKIADTGSEDK